MRSDTERAISDFEVLTFGNKRSIENAETMLTKDEKVLFVTPTSITVSSSNPRGRKTTPGVVFLTDKRILFYYQVLGFASETVPISEIRSINCSGNGLSGSYVEIHTVTKTYNILVTYKRHIVQKIQQTFENAKNNYNSAQSTSNKEPQQDVLSQIEKLASLKDKGIISENEFQSKKAELLERL